MSRWNEMKQSIGKCSKNEWKSSRTAAMASIAAAGYIFVLDTSSQYLSWGCRDWWAFKAFVDKITFFNASTAKWWEIQGYDDFVFTYFHYWINEQNFELISSPTTWIAGSPIFTIASLNDIPTFWCRFSIYNEKNNIISFPIFLFNASYWNYL